MEALRPIDYKAELEERAAAPLRRTSRGYLILMGVLLVIIAWGAYTYSIQLRDGLIVTGMRDHISWGLYIAMFVFFIGASMAGTFTSAILRITRAPWRTPIIRSAEMVTVAALITAGLFIIFDMGKRERLHNIWLFSRWESPLIWDVHGMTTYLMGSVVYFYAALIPDLAYFRDKIGVQASPLRRWLYKTLSIGWRGTPSQRHHLQRTMTIMMILLIPVAVMMHSVTSWIFAMTLREPWDSPVFAVFFVGGAIYSGTGIIIILLAAMRKAYKLENFITHRHFYYLGLLLVGMACIMFFFNLSELLTHAYKLRGDMTTHLEELFQDGMAPLFWTYLWGGIIAPMVLILLPYTRNIKGIVTAAVLVNLGMFLEHYTIVVGGLRLPLNPYELPSYFPTWNEWSLMAGGIAIFILILMILMKLVPNVALTEMLEENGIESKAAESPRPFGEPSPQPSSGGE